MNFIRTLLSTLALLLMFAQPPAQAISAPPQVQMEGDQTIDPVWPPIWWPFCP
ncbi:hypothetical protein K7W42_05555 [Deinococcus sp. HMF7604]|uniref:hypothetical protein n=1 Tax=Deinococcus betulae TaxID=2873312 RepID=UPI001CCEF4DB|nr:hypothetical protein [Deinococcus betulae]MBZ9750328.1 hypothetical protein [Deinococcus betulae]